MKIALYQPDIAQNTGTLIRLGACVDVEIHIIHPCGFIFNDKKFKRSSMDYIEISTTIEHNSFDDFYEYVKNNSLRPVLLTTKTENCYYDFKFQKNDILLLGNESSGVPAEVHKLLSSKVTIKMNENARSLNQAISAAMVLSEALKQTR